MSSEKRLIVFTLVTFVSILTIQYVMDVTGLTPPPPRPPVAQAKAGEKDQGKGGELAGGDPVPGRPGKAEGKPKAQAEAGKAAAEGGPPARSAVALATPEELILGSSRDHGPAGYRLEVQLDQKGAGVAAVLSARYEAEYEDGKKKGRPFPILKYDPGTPASLALTLRDKNAADVADASGVVATPGGGELTLDSDVWEVVREPQGRVVRTVVKTTSAPAGKNTVEGQEAVFRTKV
ncbi:MAG: hypothetical protein LC745_12515, partial [Planctomycetia bacterium]|nr:hypothetical protein [Planctomycetia bacterium]